MPKGFTGNPNGRPKGSLSARSRMLKDIADTALCKGVHPIEVMLENMRFYHAEADKLLAKVVAGKGSTPALVEALKDMCDFRDKAQQCAVDCAPYFIPKLNAVTVKGDQQQPLLAVVEHVIVKRILDGAGRPIADGSETIEVEHTAQPSVRAVIGSK